MARIGSDKVTGSDTRIGAGQRHYFACRIEDGTATVANNNVIATGGQNVVRCRTTDDDVITSARDNCVRSTDGGIKSIHFLEHTTGQPGDLTIVSDDDVASACGCNAVVAESCQHQVIAHTAVDDIVAANCGTRCG